MDKYFNKTFFRFAFGFIGILIAAFLFGIVVKDFDDRNALPANTSQQQQ